MSIILARDEALQNLQNLKGQNLRILASQYGITVFTTNGSLNKGWAGLVCEKYLELNANSKQEPDFFDPKTGLHWELKIISFKQKLDGSVVPKETMALTMINPRKVATIPFEQSDLLHKIKSLVIGGRLFVDKSERIATFLSVGAFDLDIQMLEQIRQDYNYVQMILNNAPSPEEGFLTLSGSMGVYVQPRTKGPGHGSTSRAFYFRTSALKVLFNF